jgi:hypothetical protein
MNVWAIYWRKLPSAFILASITFLDLLQALAMVSLIKNFITSMIFVNREIAVLWYALVISY